MALFITAVISIVSSTVVLGLVPGEQLAQSTFPFADAARVLWGEVGFMVIALGAAISALGALNGFVLCRTCSLPGTPPAGSTTG